MVFSVVSVPIPQVLRLVLNFSCSRIKFGIGPLNTLLTVSFSNANGVLGIAYFKGRDNGGALNQWADYSAPAGEQVTTISFECSDSVYMDNFEFHP
jgi:hypothetical protein